MSESQTGFVEVNGAKLYYERAGQGQALVMIHAGVADHRQWNNEFESFATEYHVVRYDMRGYGQSEPIDAEYTALDDLKGLLDELEITEPIVVMGCSMGGMLAMDWAFAYPEQTRGLIMVGSEPSGFMYEAFDENDPRYAPFQAASNAFKAGDLDQAAEIETKIWFDGDRSAEQINPLMRGLAFDMNRIALGHQAKELGKQLPNNDNPAAPRLTELSIPVLVIAGAQDLPDVLGSADYMAQQLPNVHKELIDNAAHLPNMDQPTTFHRLLNDFMTKITLENQSQTA